jgi:hypothetical protein
MRYGVRMNGDTITAMLAPLIFFEERCEDKETLRKLIMLANDKARRKQAHALFSEIRNKTLAAQRSGDQLAVAQYAFEETLYNITLEPAPFDPDSPFWVLPRALNAEPAAAPCIRFVISTEARTRELRRPAAGLPSFQQHAIAFIELGRRDGLSHGRVRKPLVDRQRHSLAVVFDHLIVGGTCYCVIDSANNEIR